MISYVIVLVADLASRTQKIQTLENLLNFSMHLLGRVSCQAIRLNAPPVVLSRDTRSTVKAMTVLALHWVGLNDVGA